LNIVAELSEEEAVEERTGKSRRTKRKDGERRKTEKKNAPLLLKLLRSGGES
jgi:hypothetical protein